MNILFFRIANRIAGIGADNVLEVIDGGQTTPAPPVSPAVKRLLVYRGSVVGLIDLCALLSLQVGESPRGDIILMRRQSIVYGLEVGKMLLVRSVSKMKLTAPDDSYFIPKEYIAYGCAVGRRRFPVLSEDAILRHPAVEPLWNRDVHGTPVRV